MKLKLIIIFMVIMIIPGCGEHQQPHEPEGYVPVADPEETTGLTGNALASIAYEGRYKGVLPCADCEGIETEITLDREHNFVKKTRYLGKDDDNVHEKTGSFTWNEAGNVITLEGVKPPNQYFVTLNMLTYLDIDGHRITGEMAHKYNLKKQTD